MSNASNQKQAIELSQENLNNQSNSQVPLLPRYGWQDQRAFAKTIIKVKQLLDIAEITAYLD